MEHKPGTFRTSIGGQALIEGILMRGPEKQAIVVRSPEGLVTKVEELTLIKDKYPILGLPILRGALRICRQNIRRNSLSGQVVSLKMDALSDPPPRLGDFDCLVCNPPYIPSGDIAGLDVSVRDYEPHLALDGGTDGLDFYRSVCRRWRDVLHTGSRLAFEVGIGQADDVLRLMRGEGFGELEILPDPAGIPRVVTGLRYREVYADA